MLYKYEGSVSTGYIKQTQDGSIYIHPMIQERDILKVAPLRSTEAAIPVKGNFTYYKDTADLIKEKNGYKLMDAVYHYGSDDPKLYTMLWPGRDGRMIVRDDCYKSSKGLLLEVPTKELYTPAMESNSHIGWQRSRRLMHRLLDAEADGCAEPVAPCTN